MPDKNAPSTAPEESQVAVTPDEEVAERAEELDRLREEILETRANRTRREQDLSHELRLKDLDVEKQRLLTELANEKRLDEQLTGSSDQTLQNAEAAMRLAVAQQEGIEELSRVEEDQASAKRSEETPNPLLVDSSVPDAAQPSVVAVSSPEGVAKSTSAKSNTTTGKAAK